MTLVMDRVRAELRVRGEVDIGSSCNAGIWLKEPSGRSWDLLDKDMKEKQI